MGTRRGAGLAGERLLSGTECGWEEARQLADGSAQRERAWRELARLRAHIRPGVPTVRRPLEWMLVRCAAHELDDACAAAHNPASVMMSACGIGAAEAVDVYEAMCAQAGEELAARWLAAASAPAPDARAALARAVWISELPRMLAAHMLSTPVSERAGLLRVEDRLALCGPSMLPSAPGLIAPERVMDAVASVDAEQWTAILADAMCKLSALFDGGRGGVAVRGLRISHRIAQHVREREAGR